jgi:hypothetical protein
LENVLTPQQFRRTTMFRLASLTFVLVSAVLVGLTWGAGPANADPIGPGFDLFATDPTTTFVNLGAMGGVVPLQGVPIGSLSGVNLWDTDTIVQRLQGINPFPVGGTGTIQIQLRALSMESQAPVIIGGTMFDLTVRGGDLLGIAASPVGSMTVSHTVPNGGTFVSTLPVHAVLTFTEVGNPQNTFQRNFDDVFDSVPPAVWSHTPRPDNVNTDEVPPFPAGRFHAGVDPATNGKVRIGEGARDSLSTHGALPAQIPEPSSLVLLATAGVVSLLAFGRRRLSKTT